MFEDDICVCAEMSHDTLVVCWMPLNLDTRADSNPMAMDRRLGILRSLPPHMALARLDADDKSFHGLP